MASIAKGSLSKTGTLRKVVMCPPTHFRITNPINAVQWLYRCNGHAPPSTSLIVSQHSHLVKTLHDEDVDVEIIPPVPGLPYQHATRDLGVVINDIIVLSDPREKLRRIEARVAEPILQKYGLRIERLTPELGFVEGGDIVVDGRYLWVGLGARTDMRGAEFLYHTFKNHEVIPLRFSPIYTHLDTIFGVLGNGCALVHEPAFEEVSLRRIREVYPTIISLSDTEQLNAGANVLCLGSDRVISIAENPSVNKQMVQLGFEVVTVPYSEVIKSGGSVRCDTFPVKREG